MQKRKAFKALYKLFFFTFILFTCWNCATVGTLTGGDKDITPPKIVKQTPENHTTSFSEQQIKITFDEYVLLGAPDNILISPYVEKNPGYTTKGKSLIIKFKEPLIPNTTYTISLNGAVKDITEGNVLEHADVVFSTGETIDTLMISGTVYDAFTVEPQKKIWVMLYVSERDSAPIDEPPLFITLTNENGEFSFNHIADNEYLLIALDDKNFNKKFDLKDEKIAFLSEKIRPYPIPMTQIDDTTTHIDHALLDSISSKLYLFQEQDTALRFLRKTFEREEFHKFIFSRGISDFQLTPLSDTLPKDLYIVQYNPTRDTIDLFFTKRIDDDIEFSLTVEGVLIDTLFINPCEKKAASSSKKDTLEVLPPLTYKTLNTGELKKQMCLYFDYPIQFVDSSQFLLLELQKEKRKELILNEEGEEVEIEIDVFDTLSANYFFNDSLSRSLVIDFPWKGKRKYIFSAPDSVFISYTGRYNDSIEVDINVKSIRDYGDIKISYQFLSKNTYLVQLLGEKDVVIQEDLLFEDQTIEYLYLKEGKYRIRVIEDENENSQWDTGNYLNKQQPEKIIYFEKTIDVKPNWTIEEIFLVE